MECNYKNGQLHGECRVWHYGKVVARGVYRNDEPWDGTFVIWLPEGIAVLRTYRNGFEVASEPIPGTQGAKWPIELPWP